MSAVQADAERPEEDSSADYQTGFRSIWAQRFWFLPEHERARAVEGQWQRWCRQQKNGKR
jgi:hypothetical protein